MLQKGINSENYFTANLVLLLFIPFFSFSQKDTIKIYESIEIIRNEKQKEIFAPEITRAEIDAVSPHDLGTLLQYINGLTIKNYGGIGGIKTLSNRGLGGEHTQLVKDGFPINNPQTGQINYANIQPGNIETVSLNHFETNALISASGQIKGSVIEISTFEQSFSTAPFSLRSDFTVGSFGHKEVFVGLKKSQKHKFISFSGGGKWYEGNYPYHLDFDKKKQTYYRQNNSLNDFHFSLGGGFKWKKNNVKNVLKLYANTFSINQELPNAVILYNNLSKETLKTKNTYTGINYQLDFKNFSLKTFLNYSYQFLHYNDPNYLNSDGFLDNKYNIHSAIVGFIANYDLKNWSFSAGNDFDNSRLLSNRNLGNPVRNTSTSMLKAEYRQKWVTIAGSLFSQLFFDENSMQAHRNNYHQVHPQFNVRTSRQLFENWVLSAGYKPSSRAASFNELYFSQVGNKSLIPEKSSQINLNAMYVKQLKHTFFKFSGNIFKNSVENKILALPTKNMFIWSIQNIGKVDIYGADLHLKNSIQIKDNWKINFQIGVDYQKIIDVSNENSPTYKNQIAYAPEISSNALLSINFKNAGLYISSLYIGKRYSLNENIPENLLNDYLITDLAVHYIFYLKEKNVFKINVGIKNITNESYSFIRYYVMPEINYFLKLSYEFH